MPRHASRELRRLFKQRPFQGAHPAEATTIFLGLDANFGADIHRHEIWPDLNRYLRDGVAFWRDTGVHHPFLLKNENGTYRYRRDGWRFHKMFAEAGFGVSWAGRVSFVELVPFPTVGRFDEDLGTIPEVTRHLWRVQGWLNEGPPKHIFFSAAVRRQLRRLDPHGGVIRAQVIEAGGQVAPPLRNLGIQHRHFSSWGRGAIETFQSLRTLAEQPLPFQPKAEASHALLLGLAIDQYRGALPAHLELKLLEPAGNHWFRRYARFLKEKAPDDFSSREDEWIAIGLLDHLESFDGENTEWR